MVDVTLSQDLEIAASGACKHKNAQLLHYYLLSKAMKQKCSHQVRMLNLSCHIYQRSHFLDALSSKSLKEALKVFFFFFSAAAVASELNEMLE